MKTSSKSKTLLAHKKLGLFCPTISRPCIFIEGEDRKTFLQGIMSQDLLKQEDWSLSYSFFLNPKARILFDAWCGTCNDKIALFPPSGTQKDFISHLQQYLFFRTKAKIVDLSDTFSELRLVGPDTISALLSLFDHDFSGSSFRRLRDGGYVLIHPISFQLDLNVGLQADLFIPNQDFSRIRKSLEDSVQEREGVIMDEDTYMTYLTEKGIPLFPTELNTAYFPAEAGLDTAGISYNKGCYVGQEPVTRLKFQGHINRLLSGFLISSPSSSPDTFPQTLLNPKDGNEAGILTRTAYSDILESVIGLGYLKKSVLDNDTELLLPDGRTTKTINLPFV